MATTKTEQAKQLYLSGDIKGSLKILQTFQREFNKDEKRTIQIAFECLNGKEKFYQSLKIDTINELNKAKELMKKYFDSKTKKESVITIKSLVENKLI